MFAIESKTGVFFFFFFFGIFNILKKQPQNKKNVRERTGISSHRRRNTDSQEYFLICAPSSNKTQIKVSFQSHKFAKTKGSLLLIAAMCDDVGPLTSQWGECELVQSF